MSVRGKGATSLLRCRAHIRIPKNGVDYCVILNEVLSLSSSSICPLTRSLI